MSSLANQLPGERRGEHQADQPEEGLPDRDAGVSRIRGRRGELAVLRGARRQLDTLDRDDLPTGVHATCSHPWRIAMHAPQAPIEAARLASSLGASLPRRFCLVEADDPVAVAHRGEHAR